MIRQSPLRRGIIALTVAATLSLAPLAGAGAFPLMPREPGLSQHGEGPGAALLGALKRLLTYFWPKEGPGIDPLGGH
ncbi:MAG TPA: hypothetical protein VOA87_02100 [Thermoanaerobaculia bacterium]|nr:hypothetical protein [Thermoanaerobaculia bacterium]